MAIFPKAEVDPLLREPRLLRPHRLGAYTTPRINFFDPVSISVVAAISGLGGVWTVDEAGTARVVQSGQNRHRSPTGCLLHGKHRCFLENTGDFKTDKDDPTRYDVGADVRLIVLRPDNSSAPQEAGADTEIDPGSKN